MPGHDCKCNCSDGKSVLVIQGRYEHEALASRRLAHHGVAACKQALQTEAGESLAVAETYVYTQITIQWDDGGGPI